MHYSGRQNEAQKYNSFSFPPLSLFFKTFPLKRLEITFVCVLYIYFLFIKGNQRAKPSNRQKGLSQALEKRGWRRAVKLSARAVSAKTTAYNYLLNFFNSSPFKLKVKTVTEKVLAGFVAYSKIFIRLVYRFSNSIKFVALSFCFWLLWSCGPDPGPWGVLRDRTCWDYKAKVKDVWKGKLRNSTPNGWNANYSTIWRHSD